MSLAAQMSARPTIRLPGTYAPQHDTELLIRTVLTRVPVTGRSVLDLCTGTGAVALAAARAGAASTTAVDLSRRAVLSARANARLQRARVEVLRGDLLSPVAGRKFDVVVCNPPYVPAATDRLPRHRVGRCWDGGLDGRAVLDRVCTGVAAVLNPGGTVLVTHSDANRPERTLDLLGRAGLATEVVARTAIPYGPVMRRRSALLVERGLAEPGQQLEQLVVVAGRSAPEPVPDPPGDQDRMVRTP